MSYRLKRRPKVIFILGPTGSGKTALALECARLFGGEIINADSIQVFAGVDIGAAKPTPEELEEIPHHLIGHVGLGKSYTAGDFVRDALEVIETRYEAGVSQFFVVGGSGFYIQALQKGLFATEPASPEVRAGILQKLQNEGLGALYAELQERDSVYASKVAPADRYRILRGLEVLRMGKFRSMAEVTSNFEPADRSFVMRSVGLNRRRAIFREIVRERAGEMLRRGFKEEVEGLVRRGLADWPPMKSVGYKEVQAFLNGEILEADLVEEIGRANMRLIKKQMTWFKRDPDIFWFDPDFCFHAPLKLIFEFLRESLPACREKQIEGKVIS